MRGGSANGSPMYQDRERSVPMSASRASGRPGPAEAALARQPVGRLPGHVAEEHIDLEALLERLALEQGAPSESRSA